MYLSSTRVQTKSQFNSQNNCDSPPSLQPMSLSCTCTTAARSCARSLLRTSSRPSLVHPASQIRRRAPSRRWESATTAAASTNNPKVTSIVDQISQLTLLETADLVANLKVGSNSFPYPTLLSSTLLYSTLLYSTLLYSTLLYSTLLYSTLLYSALLCSTLLFTPRRLPSKPCLCSLLTQTSPASTSPTSPPLSPPPPPAPLHPHPHPPSKKKTKHPPPRRRKRRSSR